ALKTISFTVLPINLRGVCSFSLTGSHSFAFLYSMATESGMSKFSPSATRYIFTPEILWGCPKSSAYQSEVAVDPSVVHRFVISVKYHILPSIAWYNEVSGTEFTEAEGTG